MKQARCACAFRLPKHARLSAVLVNTAGGVAGGDRFSISIDAGQDTALTLTTAAAEKVYRSHGPSATIDVSLRVAGGAHLAWLPQETILFDRARLARRIDIDLRRERLAAARRDRGVRPCGDGRSNARGRVSRPLAAAARRQADLRRNAAARRRYRPPSWRSPAIAKGGAAMATVLIAPADQETVERVRAGSQHLRRRSRRLGLERFCSRPLLR